MTLTINQAIEAIIRDIPGAPFKETVDTVKVGDPTQNVTGIAVTFLASGNVIKKVVELGCNFIITHEPVFYNHLDETEWASANASKQDRVLQAKQELVESNQLVIWRFHDYLHSIPPDNTVMGLLELLGWEKYAFEDKPYLCNIPEMSFAQVVSHVKSSLGSGRELVDKLSSLRVVGNPEMKCRRVFLMPGAPGYQWQIGVLGDPDVDVLITGEINEWETSEYVRDANEFGLPKGLIVLGHAASEEPGMRRIVPWIKERLPGVPVNFIPVGSAFR